MPRRIRGSTTERGYGGDFMKSRKAVEPLVRAGLAVCPVCGERILPGEEWHLGHSDDRASLIGALHKRCNLREAGLKTARLKRGQRTVTSQAW